jgi:hypothetical protein
MVRDCLDGSFWEFNSVAGAGFVFKGRREAAFLAGAVAFAFLGISRMAGGLALPDSGGAFMTILKKTLVDEFVWVPFFAVWQLVLGYLLIEKKGSVTEFRAALKRKPFLQRVIPLMIANWVVWIPAVSLIYLFPLPLQLPLMNIVLALWCLILTFFAKNA